MSTTLPPAVQCLRRRILERPREPDYHLQGSSREYPRRGPRGPRDAFGADSQREESRDKLRRFGFSTSEDAVTWVVFGYLALHAARGLSGLAQRLLAGSELRARLVDILDSIGEDKKRRSEPDVVLDYGSAGLAVIEVKLHAANDEAKPADVAKFDKYLRDTSAFGDPSKVKKSRMYELSRNWRIGWDLAGQRPFRLVNLGPAALFKQSERLDSFERGLAISPSRRFRADDLELVTRLSGGRPQGNAEVAKRLARLSWPSVNGGRHLTNRSEHWTVRRGNREHSEDEEDVAKDVFADTRL